MSLPATPTALAADFARRGFTLRGVAGKLSVSPASALTSHDREALRERRDELLAVVSPAEPWNTGVALRLMSDADALVERLGVSGQHHEIAAAAAVVTSAFATRDLETVRFAVAEFAATVRRVSVPARQNGGW